MDRPSSDARGEQSRFERRSDYREEDRFYRDRERESRREREDDRRTYSHSHNSAYSHPSRDERRPRSRSRDRDGPRNHSNDDAYRQRERRNDYNRHNDRSEYTAQSHRHTDTHTAGESKPHELPGHERAPNTLLGYEELSLFIDRTPRSAAEMQRERERGQDRDCRDNTDRPTHQPVSLRGMTPQFSQNTLAPEHVIKFSSGVEANQQRIEHRQKQIQYGKNTTGYDNYIAAVPKHKRKKIPEHPRTPDIYRDCSKRQFDGLVSAWRRQLHRWDVPDIRPDIHPDAVALKPRATKEAAFEEGRAVGQKRKMVDEGNDSNKHPTLGGAPTGEEELGEVKETFTFGEGEEDVEDGYVSEDVL